MSFPRFTQTFLKYYRNSTQISTVSEQQAKNLKKGLHMKIEIELPLETVGSLVESSIAAGILGTPVTPDQLILLKINNRMNDYPNNWMFISTHELTMRVLKVNKIKEENDAQYYTRCADTHKELAKRIKENKILPPIAKTKMIEEYEKIIKWFTKKASELIAFYEEQETKRKAQEKIDTDIRESKKTKTKVVSTGINLNVLEGLEG